MVLFQQAIIHLSIIASSQNELQELVRIEVMALPVLQALYNYSNIFFSVVLLEFFAQLYDIKYSYLIQIVFKQIYLICRWDPNKLLPHRVRMNVRVTVMKQYFTLSRSGTSPLDAV